MSSLESAYHRLEQAVEGLADVVDQKMASHANGGDHDLGTAENVAALKIECERLSQALKVAKSRNTELDRVVDEIHRRLGTTIADLDDLLKN